LKESNLHLEVIIVLLCECKAFFAPETRQLKYTETVIVKVYLIRKLKCEAVWLIR